MNGFASTLRSASLALVAVASFLPAQTDPDGRTPTLPPGAEALRVDEGHKVSLHVFALGVQIYRWDVAGNKWAFVGPSALLFANPCFSAPIGTHFAGPTWTSNSGSSVVGAFAAGYTVDATAIPWLRLRAVTSEGPGPFAGTTFIQRVNTTGGLAPARVGTPNEIVEVPYTAEYYFYCAK